MTQRVQMCTFRVADLFCGIEVELVQEVAYGLLRTPVPLAPPWIAGLVNLRSVVVTAVDMRQRMGVGRFEPDADPVHVVIRSDSGYLSLLADEVGDVCDVAPESFEAPPQTVHEAGRMGLRGIYKLDGELLLALDTTWVTSLKRNTGEGAA